MNKQEELGSLLQRINGIKDVEGASLVTRDGLLIASEFSKSLDSDAFAAMSATIFGAAETSLSELKKGQVDRVIVESKEMKFVAADAGSKAIIIIIVSNKANIGLVLVELKKSIKEVRRVIES